MSEVSYVDQVLCMMHEVKLRECTVCLHQVSVAASFQEDFDT